MARVSESSAMCAFVVRGSRLGRVRKVSHAPRPRARAVDSMARHGRAGTRRRADPSRSRCALYRSRSESRAACRVRGPMRAVTAIDGRGRGGPRGDASARESRCKAGHLPARAAVGAARVQKSSLNRTGAGSTPETPEPCLLRMASSSSIVTAAASRVRAAIRGRRR
jgi:hypothetical protein